MGMASQHVQVFVYGTLKRGQPNHGLMQKAENGSASYVGKGSTVNSYPLVISSQYNIPFLLPERGSGEKVEGEVYAVDNKMVAALDELESHPVFYERFQTSISQTEDENGVSLRDPKRIECWCYFLTEFKSRLLQLPFLRSYDAHGPHGLRYLASYERRKGDTEYDLIGDVKQL